MTTPTPSFFDSTDKQKINAPQKMEATKKQQYDQTKNKQESHPNTRDLYGRSFITYDKHLLSDICDIVDNGFMDIEICYVDKKWTPEYRLSETEKQDAPKYTLKTKELCYLRDSQTTTRKLDKWLRIQIQHAEIDRVVKKISQL